MLQFPTVSNMRGKFNAFSCTLADSDTLWKKDVFLKGLCNNKNLFQTHVKR